MKETKRKEGVCSVRVIRFFDVGPWWASRGGTSVGYPQLDVDMYVCRMWSVDGSIFLVWVCFVGFVCVGRSRVMWGLLYVADFLRRCSQLPLQHELVLAF